MKKLTEQDYIDAAKLLNVEVAVIKAVTEVESNGSGFLPDGQVKILFEGHYFYAFTKGKYGVSNVSYPKWVKTYYKEDQHKRLQKAAALDRDSALRSASWGMFQIMGDNFRKAGFKTIQEFINAMHKGEREHLIAFCNFVINTGLQDELQEKKWASFAFQYNGKGYRANKYDTKLEKAYNKFKVK